jgi:hypothetical protein
MVEMLKNFLNFKTNVTCTNVKESPPHDGEIL